MPKKHFSCQNWLVLVLKLINQKIQSNWIICSNGLIKKSMLISKFKTSSGKQIIQYIYYPVSQKVKAIKPWNLVS